MLWIVRHPLEKDIFDRCTELNNSLTGALTTRRKAIKVGNRFIKPPSWWVSDEEATQTNMASIRQLDSLRRR